MTALTISADICDAFSAKIGDLIAEKQIQL